jgi:hypothetical protein
MGEAHDYWMRMIIKQPRAVSTEIFPLNGHAGQELSIQELPVSGEVLPVAVGSLRQKY